MLRKRGSQKINRRESPPIERPKYTNDTFPTRQRRTEAASFSQESETLTPTNMLLLKFTFSPDIASNKTRIARIALTFAQHLVPRSNVSSANWRWVTDIDAVAPTVYPTNMFLSTTDFIIICNPSAAIRKRKGERGSPCRSPLFKGNSSVGLPLTKTEAVTVDTHSLIHFLHRMGKHFFYNTFIFQRFVAAKEYETIVFECLQQILLRIPFPF